MTETSGYNDVHKDAKIDGATDLDQSRESVLFMVEDENCWVELICSNSFASKQNGNSQPVMQLQDAVSRHGEQQLATCW